MTEHPQHCDIMVIGTGFYAEVMLADLAAHARKPLSIALCGRNTERMKWLVEACRARAVNFGSPASFSSVQLDSTSVASLAEGIAKVRPRIVVQSASAQSPWKVDNGENEWARLVAKAGFGLTLAFNALLAFRTASAIRELGEKIIFVNTCYPDGVNQVLAQAGLPISTGVGNIGIFASVIGGRIPFEQRPELRVLAHHRHIVEWRKTGTQRAGAPVRAWVGDAELDSIDDLTRDIQLPYRDLNMISAANAVPVLLALAGHGKVLAHVPGPNGIGGGYPVVVDPSGVKLDLPASLTVEEAVAWNQQFEEADGVFVRDGWVTYADRVRELLAAHSLELSQGFAVGDVEQAAAALDELRSQLSACP